MSDVKKTFQPIIDFLINNQNSLVSDILEDAKALVAKTSRAGSSSVFHRNAEGEVIAIKCYYYQKWFDVRVVEFGAKATSTTGFNTMCKDGVSHWTKRNNELKNIDRQILDEVIAGALESADIEARREELQEAINVIIPREDGYGFDTLEELLADSQARGLTV